VETENSQVERDSLVVVDIRVVGDSQAVLGSLAVTVESPVEEDRQDILGSLHIVDIPDTSQMHILQTRNHELLLTRMVRLILPLPAQCTLELNSFTTVVPHSSIKLTS